MKRDSKGYALKRLLVVIEAVFVMLFTFPAAIFAADEVTPETKEGAPYNVTYQLENLTYEGPDTIAAGEDLHVKLTAETGYGLPGEVQGYIDGELLDAGDYTYEINDPLGDEDLDDDDDEDYDDEDEDFDDEDDEDVDDEDEDLDDEDDEDLDDEDDDENLDDDDDEDVDDEDDDDVDNDPTITGAADDEDEYIDEGSDDEDLGEDEYVDEDEDPADDEDLDDEDVLDDEDEGLADEDEDLADEDLDDEDLDDDEDQDEDTVTVDAAEDEDEDIDDDDVTIGAAEDDDDEDFDDDFDEDDGDYDEYDDEDYTETADLTVSGDKITGDVLIVAGGVEYEYVTSDAGVIEKGMADAAPPETTGAASTPETGDSDMPLMMGALLIISGGILAALVLGRRLSLK